MKRGATDINCLIGIDKPAGMTSHDVIHRVRTVFGEGRVGHAGTLDPMATGVLVVGIGQGTRLMSRLTGCDKTYLAAIRFGTETSTDDAEGEVVRTVDVSDELYDADFASAKLADLVGKQMQVPPAYSAVSVDGKRAYAQARKGEVVELEPREIEIFSATLIAISDDRGPVWNCLFSVSKGTYVRSIARDLGRSLKSAAHVADLRRTSSGLIDLSACVSLEKLEELGVSGLAEIALDPTRALGLPVVSLSENEVRSAADGMRIEIAGRADASEGEEVSLVREGKLFGIWKVSGTNFVPSINFPAGISGVSA